MEADKSRPDTFKAINVTGCTGDANAAKGGGKGKGSGSCQGTVKSFVFNKGWGFIEYNGQDIFVHVKDCNGGMPQQGDSLTFDVEDKGNGQLRAVNVSGCSAWAPEFGGKGKGFGPWGGKGGGWAAGPYGGGWADAWSGFGGGCWGMDFGWGKGSKGKGKGKAW
eukprot:SRR837773.8893.p2 GENE.SRR837773.8893~~SRR837773.8893.p2  ORF type:complete len:175 (+),score=88.56 SRR837773.8893:36-527(+)